MKVRECHDEVEQEDEGLRSIAQDISRKSTDFLGGSSCQSEDKEGSSCHMRALTVIGTGWETASDVSSGHQRSNVVGGVRRAAASTISTLGE